MMNYSKEAKQSFELGIPIAFALIAQMGISLTDVALITRYGETEITAVSLALSIYSLVMVFCLGVITALSAKYAKEYVKNTDNVTKMSLIFFNGFWVSSFLSILGCTFLWFTGDILLQLNYDKNLSTIANEYNRATIPGLVSFLFYINVRCFLNAIGKAKITTKVMWVALIINLVLSYFLIFGTHGEGFLGALGAGIASSIVRIIIFLHLILLLYRHNIIGNNISISKAMLLPNKEIIFIAFVIGTPIGLRLLFSEGYLPLLSFSVAKLGDIHLIIHSISLRIESLLAVFAIGFSGAMTTFVAWSIEKNDVTQFNNKVKIVSIIMFGYVLVVSIILLLFREWILEDMFSLRSNEAAILFDPIVYLIVLYLFIDSAITISNGILVGMSDTLHSMFYNFIGYWFVTSILIYVITDNYESSVIGVWVGLSIGSVIILLLNILRILALKNSIFSNSDYGDINVKT